MDYYRFERCHFFEEKLLGYAQQPEKVSINLLKESDLVEYDVNGDVVLVVKVPRASRESRPVYINDDLMRGTFNEIGKEITIVHLVK